MTRAKFVKSIILGVCISALSTGMVFAGTIDIKRAEATVQDTGTDSELLKLQREIDKYVFEDHSDEIQKLGFSVTHTGPMDDFVEIGITPYSEENAEYLYKIFGSEKVKVVEGEKAVLYTAGGGSEPNTGVSTMVIDENLVERLDEVIDILHGDKAAEIESKGIAITHTSPLDGYIEVGILPYTEENADFIYGLLGEDMIEVTEGQEPGVEATTGIADDGVMRITGAEDGTDVAAEDNVDFAAENAPVKDDAEGKKSSVLPIAGVAGVVVLLGAAVAIAQKKKASR